MTPLDVRYNADGVVVAVTEQGVRRRRQDASDGASGNNERRRQQRTVATAAEVTRLGASPDVQDGAHIRDG